MPQADRGIKMYKYLLVFLMIFFTGCFSTQNISVENIEKLDDKNSTKIVYKDISKDAIFEAAKKAFILMGGTQFRIDSYRDSLIVSKTKLSHYPFYAHVSEEKWEISIEEKEQSSYVKVLAKRVNNYDEKDIDYLSENLHRLLFDRIDFLLGLKEDWSLCFGSMSFDDALCDMIDLKFYTNATKDDIIKNIYISQRKPSKNLVDSNDILQEDIVFTLDEQTEDILSQEDDIDTSSETREFDSEILELDKKVNSSINKTLNKNEIELDDESITNENTN